MLAHGLLASYVNQKPGYGATPGSLEGSTEPRDEKFPGSVEGSNEPRDEKLYEFKFHDIHH